VVEGEERRLRAWDFFHSPAGTAHVLVGAGEGPSVVVAVGARGGRKGLTYLAEPVALAHGAGVAEETRDLRQAHASFPPPPPPGRAHERRRGLAPRSLSPRQRPRYMPPCRATARATRFGASACRTPGQRYQRGIVVSRGGSPTRSAMWRATSSGSSTARRNKP